MGYESVSILRNTCQKLISAYVEHRLSLFPKPRIWKRMEEVVKVKKLWKLS